MCKQFNIEMSITAAESLWSNGYCERYRVVEDVKCSLDIAVAWAVSVKNLLYSLNGYIPNQIVLGRNLNMASVLKDKLPALQPEEVSSVTVENNLKAMHKALKAFVKCESSDRIKRAINHDTRSCNDVWFNTGDCVYHKQENNSIWRGLETVIGQDHKQVFVKHGSELVRVHSSRQIYADNVFMLIM